MKKSIYLFSISIALIIFFTSCEDNEQAVVPVSPVTVSFASANINLPPSVTTETISLALTNPAAKDGSITLTLSGEHVSEFTTDPVSANGTLVLPVTSGQLAVMFTLNINSSATFSNRNINFRITNVSEGLRIGTANTLSVVIASEGLPNAVNFIDMHGSLMENNEFTKVFLGLSLTAAHEGTIEVTLAQPQYYGTYYTTEPEAINGKISLQVTAGTTNLPITFIPVNNSTLNGHKTIQLSITNASGTVIKGTNLNYTLTLIDDELYGKAKSYESISNNWSIKRTYEYNEAGKISKITWIQNSLSGVYTFHYNEVGELIKRQEDAITETRYIRNTQGQIVLSEKFQGGVLKKYTMYGYDPAGNIGEEAIFDLQPSGEFLMTSVFVNLYDINTNQLVKRLLYNPQTDDEDFELMQEETYEYFVQYYPANQFPMVEIIPGWNIQTMYPSRYTKKHYGMNFTYDFSYVFNDKAMPIRRNITNNTETTTYEYY